MAEAVHSQAPHYIPGFLPGPDGGDGLFTLIIGTTLLIVLLVGVAYFTLHALPEKMAHKANSTQLQLIGILTLLALFTHNNIFWVMALLLAAIRIPDIATPLNSIARSLERMGGGGGAAPVETAPVAASASAAPVAPVSPPVAPPVAPLTETSGASSSAAAEGKNKGEATDA